jgi:hypothetical protein
LCPILYVCVFVREICHFHYPISGPHSNGLWSVNTLQNVLCGRSRTSEKYFVSCKHEYYFHVDMWCVVYYTKKTFIVVCCVIRGRWS